MTRHLQPFLALNGPFTGETISHVKRCYGPRLTLDIVLDAPILVQVWRRPLGQWWTMLDYESRETQHLLKPGPGETFRLAVLGTAEGSVRLLAGAQA